MGFIIFVINLFFLYWLIRLIFKGVLYLLAFWAKKSTDDINRQTNSYRTYQKASRTDKTGSFNLDDIEDAEFREAE